MFFHTFVPGFKYYFYAELILMVLFWWVGLTWVNAIIIGDYFTGFVLYYFYPKIYGTIDSFLESKWIHILTGILVSSLLISTVFLVYKKLNIASLSPSKPSSIPQAPVQGYIQ